MTKHRPTRSIRRALAGALTTLLLLASFATPSLADWHVGTIQSARVRPSLVDREKQVDHDLVEAIDEVSQRRRELEDLRGAALIPLVREGLHEVDQVEVRWPRGAVTRLTDLEADRYHELQEPDGD